MEAANITRFSRKVSCRSLQIVTERGPGTGKKMEAANILYFNRKVR
jgi:hypothetical protein